MIGEFYSNEGGWEYSSSEDDDGIFTFTHIALYSDDIRSKAMRYRISTTVGNKVTLKNGFFIRIKSDGQECYLQAIARRLFHSNAVNMTHKHQF